MIEVIYAAPVASFIFALTIGLSLFVFSNPRLYGKLMLHPYSLYRDRKRFFSLFSSGLIHKDWMHLLFNMVTFFYFGFALEQMFVTFSGTLGHVYFALLYLLSLILSDIPTLLQQKDNPGYYSLGASGAVCALLFSFILFEPNATIELFLAIPMPAYLFALLFVGYSFWASKQKHDSINHEAHLFGALTGVVITLLMYPWAMGHFIGSF